MEISQLREFAERYAAAWCSGNAASVAAHYTANGSLTINDGAPAVGQSAITEAAQGFMTTFPDLQVLLDDVFIKGERAEFHWTAIGTNTGPGGTGHRVRFSGYEEWKIGEDGLIAGSKGHFDQADYEHQLKHGVAKPK